MNCLYRSVAPPMALFCAVLLGAAAAHTADDLVTEPEKCLFLGAPMWLAFLQEENLLLMSNFNGAYAFDIASGAQVWHRYFASPHAPHGATFGQRKVLGWSDQGVFLLDPKTGHETWSRNDYYCGAILSAMLSPDETQVLVVCKRGCILYTMATHSMVVLPRPANANVYGWLPGNENTTASNDTGEDWNDLGMVICLTAYKQFYNVRTISCGEHITRKSHLLTKHTKEELSLVRRKSIS